MIWFSFKSVEGKDSALFSPENFGHLFSIELFLSALLSLLSPLRLLMPMGPLSPSVPVFLGSFVLFFPLLKLFSLVFQ